MDETTLNEEIKKYICPVVYCPFTSAVIIAGHQMTLRKAAALKAILEQNRIYLPELELGKPFFQALWESYGRGF